MLLLQANNQSSKQGLMQYVIAHLKEDGKPLGQNCFFGQSLVTYLNFTALI